MSPHETRPDSPLETPKEPQDLCQERRGTLSFWPQLQMKTSAPVATAEESREAAGNPHGDWTFSGPTSGSLRAPPKPERNPKFAAATPEKNRRFSPQREMKAFSAVASQEKSHLPS